MNKEVTYADIRSLENQDRLEEAMTLARQLLGLYKQQAISVLEMNQLLLTMSRLASKMGSDECLDFLDKVLRCSPKTDEEIRLYSNALYIRAIHFSLKGRFDESLEAYMKNIEFIEQYMKDDKKLYLASCHYRIATLYGSKEDKKNLYFATDFLEKHLSNIDINNPEYLSSATFLVSIYIGLYEPEKATSHISTLLLTLKEKGYEGTEIGATVLALQARYFFLLGDLEQGALAVSRAVERAVAIDSRTITQTLHAFQQLCFLAEKYGDIYQTTDAFLHLFDYFSLIKATSQRMYLLISACKAAALEQNKAKAEYYISLLERYAEEDNLPPGILYLTQIYVVQAQVLCDLVPHKHEYLRTIADVWKAEEPFGERSLLLFEAYSIAADMDCSIQAKKEQIAILLAQVDALTPTDKENIMFRYEKQRLIDIISKKINETAKNEENLTEHEQRCLSNSERPAGIQNFIEATIVRCKFLFVSFVERHAHRHSQKLSLEIEHYKKALALSETKVETIKQECSAVKALLLGASQAENKTSMTDFISKPDIRQALYRIDNLLQSSLPSAMPETVLECPPSLRVKLINIANNLSNKELNFCYLVLRGWEISAICKALDLKESSIFKFRYRLARKLGLPRKARLYDFLLSLESK